MSNASIAAGISPAPATSPAAPAAAPTVAPVVSATPVAAQPAAAPTAPPAEPPSTGTPTTADIANLLTPDERKMVASGAKNLRDVLSARPGFAVPPPAPAASPAPVAPAPGSPVAPAATPSPEDHAELPDRFRFKDMPDRVIALIAKTKGVSLPEAVRIFTQENPGANQPAAVAPGTAAPAATPPPAPAPDVTLQTYDQQISAAESEIAKLTTARKAARDEVEMDKADALSDAIAEKRSELVLLKNERVGYQRNQQQAAQSSYEQAANNSRDRALAKYEQLQSEGSLHRMALDTYISNELANPARAQDFKQPNWPERLIEEFASKHAIQPKGAGANPAVTSPASAPATAVVAPTALTRAPVVQVPGARLVSGSDGVTPSAPSLVTKEQLLADLNKMTAEQRVALIRGKPVPAR